MRALLPRQLIDLSRVAEIRLDGRGGGESQVAALFPQWRRVPASLYDYEIEHRERRYRLEIKKQQSVQWFDICKYHALSPDARDVRMCFINHRAGSIVLIALILLGDLIDLLCADTQQERHGWTRRTIQAAAKLRDQHPTLQFKAKLDVDWAVRRHREKFDIVYERAR